MLALIWLMLLAGTLLGLAAGALVGKQLGHSLFFGTSIVVLAVLPICAAFLGMLWGIAHFETVVVSAMDFSKQIGFWEFWPPFSAATGLVASGIYLLRVWVA